VWEERLEKYDEETSAEARRVERVEEERKVEVWGGRRNGGNGMENEALTSFCLRPQNTVPDLPAWLPESSGITYTKQLPTFRPEAPRR
jgi:hypothetical protein